MKHSYPFVLPKSQSFRIIPFAGTLLASIALLTEFRSKNISDIVQQYIQTDGGKVGRGGVMVQLRVKHM